MNPSIERAPLMLLAAAMVLLPFGRMVEIPMAVLSLLGVWALWHGIERRVGMPWRTLMLVYLAFTVPMLLALPDAVAPGKSLRSTVGSLRFALSSIGMLWVLQESTGGRQRQAELLKGVGLVCAVLLVAWNLDGLLQSITGRNLLGYGIGEGYINGVFGEDDNIKFGITVALLLPVGFVYALRHWPLPASLAFLGLAVLLIALSGKRAAWIATSVELGALLVYYRWRGSLGTRQVATALIGVLLAVGVAYASSDWVKSRSQVVAVALDEPGYDTLYAATGKRLPIWSTAVAMGRDNWLNGVGPRGFRFAYADYAAAGDHWAEPLEGSAGSRGVHAHQLLLDLLAETGIFGVAGYGIIIALLWRRWVQASSEARSRALPYGVGLVGMLFPLNTHPAWYSSWSSLFLWTFIALYLYALSEPTAADELS